MLREVVRRILALLNPKRRLARWPLKWALFLIALGVALFPNPVQLARSARHWSHLETLPDPNNPAVMEWAAAVRADAGDEATDAELIDDVEQYVLTIIPYGWDWDVWGNADYLPTVDEIAAMHPMREDCDGRALVAASILQRLGIDARLVTDLKHVWVWTPKKETMSPGGPKVVSSDEKGTHVNLAALSTLPRTLAFSVAVFPAWRELPLLLLIWLLLLGRRQAWVAAAGGLLALLLSWGLFKGLCGDPWSTSAGPVWGCWAGWALLAVGLVATIAAARMGRRRESAAETATPASLTAAS